MFNGTFSLYLSILGCVFLPCGSLERGFGVERNTLSTSSLYRFPLTKCELTIDTQVMGGRKSSRSRNVWVAMAVELPVNGCRCKGEERGVVNNAWKLPRRRPYSRSLANTNQIMYNLKLQMGAIQIERQISFIEISPFFKLYYVSMVVSVNSYASITSYSQSWRIFGKQAVLIFSW